MASRSSRQSYSHNNNNNNNGSSSSSTSSSSSSAVSSRTTVGHAQPAHNSSGRPKPPSATSRRSVTPNSRTQSFHSDQGLSLSLSHTHTHTHTHTKSICLVYLFWNLKYLLTFKCFDLFLI